MRLEEVEKVLAHGSIALGAGYPGHQDGRQQGALFDVEVIAGAGQVLQRVVAEAVVSSAEGKKGKERQERGGYQHHRDLSHGTCTGEW